jgi:hypothetical protein
MSAIATQLIGPVFGLIDDLFHTPEEKAAAKIKVMELAAAGDLGQLEVNKTEASHKSVFVAGWRPFIGWTCALAVFMAYVLFPLVETGAFYAYQWYGVEFDATGLPALGLQELMPLMMGMLGLGSLRTFEKHKGVA